MTIFRENVRGFFTSPGCVPGRLCRRGDDSFTVGRSTEVINVHELSFRDYQSDVTRTL